MYNYKLQSIIKLCSLQQETCAFHKEWVFGNIKIKVYKDNLIDLLELDGFFDPHSHSDIIVDTTWNIYILCSLEGNYCPSSVCPINHEEYDFLETEYSSYTLKHPETKNVWLVRNGARSYQFIQDIYCAVRRIVGFELFSCGAALFHAAAVSINNKAILIAGPKKSGKSTLANFLMFDCGANYIAGDKTFCWTDKGSINCTGLIGSIKIQPDSYSMTQSIGYKRLMSFVKTNIQDTDKWIGAKATINPQIFMDITCIKIIPKLVLGTFIFLDSESDHITPLSKKTVRDCVESTITDDIYEGVVKEKENAQRINSSVINRISNAVNCFSIPKYPSREMIFEFCKKNLF